MSGNSMVRGSHSSATTRAGIPSDCEFVMLDMDGTLLDLAFDNYVWKQLVPERFAEHRLWPLDAARAHLYEQYREAQGSLDWYCLDHWSDHLGFDTLALHREVQHRIRYLPGAEEFLGLLRQGDRQILLVTNAHPDMLQLKLEVTGLGQYFDGVHSSHHYGYPKERQEFWVALEDDLGFDAATSLFVDDSEAVLDSAGRFGIGSLVTVTRPDSGEPMRTNSKFAAVEAVRDLLPAITG